MISKKDTSGLSGQRKRVAETNAIRFERVWPKTDEARQKQFKAWRDIAMQILNANKASFRLMCVYGDAMNWENGEVWDSDEELAHAAGRCGKKTISREVSLHRKLGIILIEHGWRDKFGKKIRTRKIKMAVPKDMPAYVHLS